MILILGAYSIKSIARNAAWKDDPTLFTTDVQTSTESAKGNAAAAAIYREKAEASVMRDEQEKYYQLTIQHFTKALEVYPGYFDVCLDLGVVHYKYNKNLELTLELFKKAYLINSLNPKSLQFANAIFNEANNPQRKRAFYLELNELTPNRFDILYALGSIHGKDMNDLPAAISWFEKAIAVNPNSADAYKDLGVAYGFSGQYEKSIEMSLKAARLKPDDAQIFVNIGINYRTLGMEKEAEEFFAKAAALDPKYKNQ
jgi:tetratricopeptide (TPR) repeat protein